MISSVQVVNIPARKRVCLASLLCLLSGGSLLGLSTNLAKLADQAHLPPLAFLCWSIIGAAFVLMLVSALRRDLPPVNRRTLEYYAVSALVGVAGRSEEHTSELQSLMRISYAVFCLKKKNNN